MLTYLLFALSGLPVVAIVIAAVLWPRPLLFALPVLAVLNGVTLPVAGMQVRTDQLAACALAFALLVAIIRGERTLQLDAVAWWLAALFGINVVASLVNSPVPSYSLLQCANLASAWVIYVVLINYLDSADAVARFTRVLLRAAAVASAVGIAAFALNLVGVPVGGAEVSRAAAERLTNAFGAYGTMFEPNIFASFTGASFVLAAGLLARTADSPDDSTGLLRWVAALAGAGLVLSFTRAAWLGAVAGCVVLITLGGRALLARLELRRAVVPVMVGLMVIGVLGLVSDNTSVLLRYKLTNLFNLESQSAVLRLTTYALAADQWLAHPWLGHGTFTFAALVAEGSDFQRFEGWRNLWIGNFLVLGLHDTGVVGLVMWCGMLWSVLRRGALAMRALRSTNAATVEDRHAAQRALALTAAVASLLIPFLATSGFSLGYSWVFIGLLGAQSRLALTHATPAHAMASRSVLQRSPTPGAALPNQALPVRAGGSE